jgi:hypothetical protein
MIPYGEVDGVRNMTDSYLAGLFARMKAEGLVERAFYDGSIRSAGEFIRMFRAPVNRLFLAGRGDDLGGIVWMTNFEGRMAQAHFCFFACSRGKSDFWALPLARFALSYMVGMKFPRSDEYITDVIVGVTPKTNRTAARFIERSGCTIACEIPHLCYLHYERRTVPGIVSHYTREAANG